MKVSDEVISAAHKQFIVDASAQLKRFGMKPAKLETCVSGMSDGWWACYRFLQTIGLEHVRSEISD